MPDAGVCVPVDVAGQVLNTLLCGLQYRPHALDKFVLHQDIAANLKKLVSADSLCCSLFATAALSSTQEQSEQ